MLELLNENQKIYSNYYYTSIAERMIELDYKDIKKLIDDMGNSNLDSLEIEFPEGIKISMTKNTGKEKEVIITKQANVIEGSAPMTVPTVREDKGTSLVNVQKEDERDYKIVKSPMVGTFYASSSPDKEPFVGVGDKVQKGQVLCIVEEMKLMNEIESEFDGEIVEICAKNEDIVEYGTPLFKIK